MKQLTLGLTTAFLLAASGGALAADEPKDLVEYREAVMTALGGHAGSIARIVKGQVSYDHIQAHADAIAATAPLLRDLFPESSSPSAYADTEALPAIWEQAPAFETALEQFETAAEAFQAAAGSGERAQVLAAFQKLGGACGGCHEDFRAED